MLACFALTALLALSTVPTQDPSASELATAPDAQRILETMREVYATAATYRDRGRVETVFVRPDRTWNRLLEFETAFVRPGRFFFEYNEHDVHEIGPIRSERSTRYVIWQDDSGASSWWTVKPEVRRWDDLKRAVSAARGVSRVASTRAASLLLPEIGWEDLLHVVEARVIAVEAVDGAPCWRIAATTRSTAFEVWIDRETHLVRRVWREREHDGFTTRTTWTYTPEVGVAIPPERFAFEPPE